MLRVDEFYTAVLAETRDCLNTLALLRALHPIVEKPERKRDMTYSSSRWLVFFACAVPMDRDCVFFTHDRSVLLGVEHCSDPTDFMAHVSCYGDTSRRSLCNLRKNHPLKRPSSARSFLFMDQGMMHG